ncbi:unnamed protein product, partial [marine sediment metagenome]
DELEKHFPVDGAETLEQLCGVCGQDDGGNIWGGVG